MRLVSWDDFRRHISNAFAHQPNTKIPQFLVFNITTAVTAGDGATYLFIPAALNGMNLVAVQAHVFTVSSSGAVNIMIHNFTDGVDMLSTAITIDANEKDSSTAATPAVINTDYDDVATGDEIRIDIDAAGTGTLGLEIALTFRRG